MQVGCRAECSGTATTTPAGSGLSLPALQQLLAELTAPASPVPAPAVEQTVVEQTSTQVQQGGSDQSELAVQLDATLQTIATSAAAPVAVDQATQGIYQLQVGCLFDCADTDQAQQAQTSATVQAEGGPTGPTVTVVDTSVADIFQLQIGCLFQCVDTVEVQVASVVQSVTTAAPAAPAAGSDPPPAGGQTGTAPSTAPATAASAPVAPASPVGSVPAAPAPDVQAPAPAAPADGPGSGSAPSSAHPGHDPGSGASTRARRFSGGASLLPIVAGSALSPVDLAGGIGSADHVAPAPDIPRPVASRQHGMRVARTAPRVITVVPPVRRPSLAGGRDISPSPLLLAAVALVFVLVLLVSAWRDAVARV